MHLVEILLPVADNEGRRFDARKYAEVRQELSRLFWRHHHFARAPAHGTSEAHGGEIVHDDIAVSEVMTDSLWGPGAGRLPFGVGLS